MEQEKTTREKILDVSLDLFSQKGYDGISIRDIAKEVGIRSSSIYSHFDGKAAIFHELLDVMDARYREEAGNLDLNGKNAEQDADLFNSIDEKKLEEMVREMFLYFLHDEYASKFRRMLTMEQFRSKELAEYYDGQYITRPTHYLEVLFGILTKKYTLSGSDVELMALHFYSTIYYLLTLCDRRPEMEEKSLDLLNRHVAQFVEKYRGSL